MKHEQIFTQHAPAPIGPYSQAIQAGNELYCSGQIPLDPVTAELVGDDAGTQAERVIENIGAVLCAAGYLYADVVKTTIFLDRHERLRRRQRRLRKGLRRDQTRALDGRRRGPPSRRTRRDRMHR